MVHPARTMTFDELWDGLQSAIAEGLVYEVAGTDGLRLYCYSQSCVYERQWNTITKLARGLILDADVKRIVATPFPKFFNIGEQIDSIPDVPFETFEKLDGSLIILFHHNRKWQCATKGSLGSAQAKWAAEWIRDYDLSHLDPTATYLTEAIYPENRIVVHYTHAGLTFLGAFRGDGTEYGYGELRELGDKLSWRIANRHSFASVSDLLAVVKTLPPTEEGFVLRFVDGLRLKVKGEEYCRIHRMVSRVTPLALWEMMQAGDDMQTMRRELPEEFWDDFDAIIAALLKKIDDLVAAVKIEAEPIAGLTDKEVGLQLASFPEEVRRFIFPYRKSGGNLLSDRTREAVFRSIRPTGNVLDGYVPSYAINRVLDEAL